MVKKKKRHVHSWGMVSDYHMKCRKCGAVKATNTWSSTDI